MKTIKIKDYCTSQQGFTLIEIAIVMVIIGLLMGGGISIMGILNERKARNESVDYLKQAKEAVLSFAAINGRFPRPDTNTDGQEDSCAVPCRGFLPYQTLGISPTDYYKRELRYEINTNLASDLNTSCSTLSSGLSARPTVIDSDGTAAAFSVAAVLVSSGQKDEDVNGNVFDDVTTGTFQGDNSDGTPNYLRSPPLEGTFDDLVIYINEGELFESLSCLELLKRWIVTINNTSGSTVYLHDTTNNSCLGRIDNNNVKNFSLTRNHSIDIMDNFSGGVHVSSAPDALSASPVTGNISIAVP